MEMTLEIARTEASEANMQEHRHRARWMLRILVGLVLAAAFIEAALRFGLGLGNPVLIEPDSACSYILKPDQDVRRFFVHTRINHYGMRSDGVTLPHKAGTLRLLFVGDSLTYGTTQVDQQKIFTEVLHRELPGIVHQPVEVLNASAGAWAPDNELSYIRSRGIFQSDLVLLVLNDGDLTQPRATIADVGDNLQQRRPLTAIGELYSRYIRPRIAHVTGKTDAGDIIAGNADEVLRANLQDLDSFSQLVRSQGARLVLIYIPFRKDIPQEAASSEEVLHEWSGARHVKMCDLTSAESPFSAEEITLDNGIHLNARGHLVVARAIEKSWPELAREEDMR
jgi:hypothetical protein